jgi:ferredoxin/flavodoxin---NADP+ reductase
MSAPEIEPYNATIVSWHPVAGGLAIFRVRPDSGRVPAFEPGQYATLGLPRDHPPVADPHEFPCGDPRWKKLWRLDYSIASAATCRDFLEFYAVHVGGGRLTDKLFAAGAGGRVWLDEHIRGEFTLQGVPDDRDLVLVATGTGLGPYMSMLRTYRGRGRWRRLAVVHGVRHAGELGYRDELQQMAAEDSSIAYCPTCSREPAGEAWDGLRGRVLEHLHPDRFEQVTGFSLVAASCHVFLCGNPEMIRDAQSQLVPAGFALHMQGRPGNLHIEQYWNA